MKAGLPHIPDLVLVVPGGDTTFVLNGAGRRGFLLARLSPEKAFFVSIERLVKMQLRAWPAQM